MKDKIHTYAFEKHDVWKNGIELVLNISDIVDKWPVKKRFDLTSQISRASTSITCNISEGSGKLTPKAQNNYYNIAYSSTLEVLNCLIISQLKKYTLEEDYLKNRLIIQKITFALNQMVKANNKKINS